MKYRLTLALMAALCLSPVALYAQEEPETAEEEPSADPLGQLLESLGGLGGEGGSAGMIASMLKGMPPEQIQELMTQFLAGLSPEEKQEFRATLLEALNEGEESTPEPEAPPPIDEEALHEELRKLKDDLIAASNKADMDALLALCTDRVVFTSPDGRIAHGPEEVRKYYAEMMTGPDPYVKKFTANPVVDEGGTILYGPDAGVATGKSLDQFELKSGVKFDLNTRWSATVVKDDTDGKWRVASYQTAVNVFDNPMLDAAKSALYWTGGIAGGVGLVLGAVISAIGGKMRAKTT